MNHIKFSIVWASLLAIIIFSGCEEKASNPEFGANDVPRIFGWNNTITTNLGDTVRMAVQVSPANDASFTWYVDSVKVSEGLSFEYVFNEVKNSIIRFEAIRNEVLNYREASVLVIKPFIAKEYNKKMVAFITRDGSFEDIDFESMTHLVITSAVVGEVEGQGSLVDTNFTDLDIPLIVKAAHNAGVYVFLDVTGEIININGGGYYANYGFYDVISDPAKQALAIETFIKFAVDNEMDGINIYLNNTLENTLDPVIVESFFRAIPSQLPEGPNGKFFYTASVTGGWTTGNLSTIAAIEEIDWVNLHAFRYEDLTAVPHSPFSAITSLCDTWLGFGLPKEKIVGGFPAFGLHYFLPSDTTIEVTWPNLWQYTAYESYKSILERDPTANTKNVLPVDDGIFYDGQADVQQKAQYILDNEMGGLMLWSLESDTRDATKSLLITANSALGN